MGQGTPLLSPDPEDSSQHQSEKSERFKQSLYLRVFGKRCCNSSGKGLQSKDDCTGGGGEGVQGTRQHQIEKTSSMPSSPQRKAHSKTSPVKPATRQSGACISRAKSRAVLLLSLRVSQSRVLRTGVLGFEV